VRLPAQALLRKPDALPVTECIWIGSDNRQGPKDEVCWVPGRVALGLLVNLRLANARYKMTSKSIEMRSTPIH